MKYIFGLLIAVSFIVLIQKFIPDVDPLSQGGFLIYSPVLFILFMTFYSSNEKKKQEALNTKSKNTEPTELLIEDESDELTPDYIHLLSKKELPEPINKLSSYDIQKYFALIKDLKHFSVDTKAKLKQLVNECKEQVLLEAEEKWYSILEKTQGKIDHYKKEGGYMVAESYEDEYAKWEERQTVISNIGFFNGALKVKFKSEAVEYFKNKQKS